MTVLHNDVYASVVSLSNQGAGFVFKGGDSPLFLFLSLLGGHRG